MFTLLLPILALAGEPVTMDAETYREQVPLEGPDSDDFAKIESCLRAWGDTHPFTTEASRRFRPLNGSTRVLHFGGKERIYDEIRTEEPVLVLVDVSVSVASSNFLFLENPNGWYCLDRSVAVAGKVIANTACEAHVADAKEGFDFLGKTDGREGGVNVLGQLRVNRQCGD